MASNTSNKCKTMNDLPNELVILIIENLGLRHLIQCSLVCRRFKVLCQDVKVPEVIISNTANILKDHWFFTNKQVNHENAISVTTFNSYRSTFRLDKLRRLYFDGYSSEYAQLKLNEFTHLEQVAINFHFPDRDNVRHEFNINLPNLKIIEIDSKTNQHKFFITTPELEMLKYTKFSSIDLTYVDTIRHLETDFSTESCHLLDEEEIPLIKHIRDLKLTTLSCNRHRYIGYELEAIKKLAQEKRKHRRSLPKIYFLSVEVDDVERINEYESHCDKFLFQISNYNLLADTVSKDTLLDREINYNQLMTTMKGKIPDDFCKRFSSARKVCVNKKVENPERLIGFLKNFEYLQELRLKSDPLDESFYSQLGELDQLTFLLVYDSQMQPFDISKLTFNFDFLLKLKHLEQFNTNFDTPNSLDLALELFTQSKHLRYMRFYFGGKFVFIYVNGEPNMYNLIGGGCKKCGLDFNELVREVSVIRG